LNQLIFKSSRSKEKFEILKEMARLESKFSNHEKGIDLALQNALKFNNMWGYGISLDGLPAADFRQNKNRNTHIKFRIFRFGGYNHARIERNY
jgi:hypothetical protein